MEAAKLKLQNRSGSTIRAGFDKGVAKAKVATEDRSEALPIMSQIV
jgi:hypothetical protein